MTPERWQQIDTLLDAVLELEPAQRQVYLDRNCPDDPELRREILSLLDAHGSASHFLEEPAKDYAASLIPMEDDLTSDPLVGQEIDGYRILSVLGRGGMGIVYKALDINLDKEVALKMIDPALARDATFVRRFRSEARALARIDSRHIVRVHAMRQTDVGLYIIMECVDGGTLTDLLRDGPISWKQAQPIVRQMLRALEHAHSVGVIHRDIKPGNIMLTSDGVVKVTDFGLAKLHQPEGTTTVTQGIAGTLYYMSPEQVQGLSTIDHRSDLYSMGMTIYQMLAGRLPLDRDSNQFTIMRAIVEEPLPPIKTFKPNLSPVVVAALDKALQKDPADRFQSAAEMRTAFDGAGYASTNDEDKTVVVDAYESDKQGRKKPLLLWGGGLGVLALVVLIIIFWPIGPAPAQVTIHSSPTEATVFLGNTTLGTTPLERVSVEDVEGAVTLQISKAGYLPVDTMLVLASGDRHILNIQLQSLASDTSGVLNATLRITSSVGDARVLINGAEAGRTDASGTLVVPDLSPGDLRVTVQKDGYDDWTDTILADAGEEVMLQPTLRRRAQQNDDDNPPPAQTATLTLNVAPEGSIEVAGESCQAGVACTVSAGRKEVTFRHPRYGAETRTITLSGGGREARTFYFEQPVIVQVRDANTGGPVWGTIFIDGQQAGMMQDLARNLGPGTHTVSVSRDSYDVLTPPQEVTITPGFQEQEPTVVVFQIRAQ